MGGISAVIVGYTQVINTMTYGALFGGVIGLDVGVLELAATSAQRSREVFIWVIGGSIIAPIIGFGTVIIVGG